MALAIFAELVIISFVPTKLAVTALAANLDAQIEDQKNPTTETKTIGG